MKVLVTGGCGFVGRHFVKRFLDQGDEVTVIDNMTTGVPPEDWMFKPESIKNQRMMFADIRTYFHTAKPEWHDLIVHCAAVVGGRLNIENDPLGVATDLSIDAEMFNWAVRGQPMPKVIYFSSPAAYPNWMQTKTEHRQLKEDDITFGGDRIGLPDLTYGWAKLSGEYLAKFAVEKYKLDVKIYRPFGGYGEDQHKSYPFPAIIQRVVNGEDPVIVWGSGKQQRDFIHIDDIVSCVLATKDVMEPGEALNIGTGKGIDFTTLAHLACEVLGKKLLIRNDAEKPEGVFSRVADCTKMIQWYKPKIGLADGIDRVARALTKAKEIA